MEEKTAAPTPQHTVECEKMLKAWDDNELVHTIEMGGLGPGYEQCIHILAFECLRALLATPPTGDNERDFMESFNAITDAAIRKADEGLGGVSGAQAGAARTLAYHWRYGVGPEAMQQQVEPDRRIMVRKQFPQA